MRRLPSNLTTLTDLETRMAAEAAALAKTRRALGRKKLRLEQHAQQQRYIAVGQLVERVGLPIDDMGTLEQMLKPLGQHTTPPDTPRIMSNTSIVTIDAQDTPQ